MTQTTPLLWKIFHPGQNAAILNPFAKFEEPHPSQKQWSSLINDASPEMATYDIDKLRKFQSKANVNIVAGIDHWSDYFVVTTFV